MTELHGTRYFKFKDDEIYELLKQKDQLVTKLQEMQAEIDKIAADGNVDAGKIQKIKDKSIPLMEEKTKEVKLERNLVFDCPNCKWETITSFKIDGDEVSVEIVNLIDAEKDRILVAEEERKQKEINENSSRNTDGGASPLETGSVDSPNV